MSDSQQPMRSRERRSIHVEVPRAVARQVRMAAVERDVPLRVIVEEALAAAGYAVAEPGENNK